VGDVELKRENEEVLHLSGLGDCVIWVRARRALSSAANPTLRRPCLSNLRDSIAQLSC